jgi:hypothetical protein
MNFEKEATDPNRLFGKSVRLLEEEKFRKTAYPTLTKLEKKLEKAILQFEASKNENIHD